MSDASAESGEDDLPPDQEWAQDDGEDLEPYFLGMLRRGCSDRKFRLTLCGCVRRHWASLNAQSRDVLESIERYADDLVGDDERDRVVNVVRDNAGTAAGAAVAHLCYHPESSYWLDHARDIVSGYLAPLESAPDPYKPYRDIVRCVTGNPFRPVVFDPAWRSDTAVSLARHIYESRDFSAMPILADALQDAGCDSGDVLDHCRGPGPHVRGCWVVDLVLGKE